MKRVISLSLSTVVFIMLAATACGSGIPDSPTATPPAPSPTPEPPPLTPVTDDPNALIESTPLERTASGSLRRPGLIIALVEQDFSTGLLRDPVAGVELVSLSDPNRVTGWRTLVVRVRDPEIADWIARIQGLPGVRSAAEFVVAEGTAGPNDAAWPAQVYSGLGRLDLPRAWEAGGAGLSSVTVGVLDSGINPYFELSGNILPGVNVQGGDVEDTFDPHGHGTMVATIIAAQKNNFYGIAGVASGVRVLPIRSCHPEGAVSICDSDDVEAGLSYALELADEGAIDVLNMSLGTPDYQSNWEDYLDLLDQLGVIVVASSGNSGNSGVLYPARSEHVVAVGGAGANGSRHPLSNYGPELDVLGPFSTFAVDHLGQTVPFNATSASTAVISGLAALFRSTAVDRYNDRGAFVQAMMQYRTWNPQSGWGVPDAHQTTAFFGCYRIDVVPDGVVDLVDHQTIAYAYGTFDEWADPFPPIERSLLFNPRYDVQPFLFPDGMIRVFDIITVSSRSGVCPS